MMFDFHPGTYAKQITVPKPNRKYDFETDVIGYEAVIDGLRYSTVNATQLAGTKLEFKDGHPQSGFSYSEMLFKTPRGRFFSLKNNKILALSEREARTIFGNSYTKHVSAEEAFGSPIEEA